MRHEGIKVIFNVALGMVERVPQNWNGKPVNYFYKMTGRNKTSNELLIWTPEMKTLWKDHYGTESEYFNKTNLIFFTSAVTDIKNEIRSFSPLIFYWPSNKTKFYEKS